MLKKLRFLVFIGVLLVCSIPLAAGAYVITYDYTADGNYFTSSYFTTTEDFDGTLVWSWSGSGEVVSGSLVNKYSAPAGIDGTKEDTNYVTVPDPDGGASGTFLATGLGGYYNYFGLWWGSVDTYNTLSFFHDGTLVESFNGTAITTPNEANGNQTAPTTNLYVNFIDLKPFNSFELSSTQFAFEADNLTIGVVPEPTTMLLLGLGLLGVTVIRRKI